MDLPHGIQRAAPWPIGILLQLQIGLENRFEHQNCRRLCHAIFDRGPPTASAFHPAWVSTPAVRTAVDTFYFSALASVRPTTSLPRMLRCPQRSDHPRRGSGIGFAPLVGESHDIFAIDLVVHGEIDSWAFLRLWRATSVCNFRTLTGVVRLIANPSVRCRFLRFPSTQAPSLHRNYPASSVLRASPPSHTARPVSRELPVDPYRDHRWDFPCCAWSTLLACRRQYPGRSDGICSLVRFHSLRPSPKPGRVGSCITLFEACSAFTHVTACTLAKSPSDPLHRRLQQFRCLHYCSDCYRAERTSSRVGFSPTMNHRLFTAHPVC